MHKRFRKTTKDMAAEAWVELGALRFKVELYENGEFVAKKSGFRGRSEQIEAHLSGEVFAVLVRIQSDGTVRCTWSR